MYILLRPSWSFLLDENDMSLVIVFSVRIVVLFLLANYMRENTELNRTKNGNNQTRTITTPSR